MANQGIEHQSSYTFTSVKILSDRAPSHEPEISAAVTDLDIYEHLDKPYLTGEITFLDNVNLIAKMDILGGERLTITFKSLEQNSTQIDKVFFIEKIKLRGSANHIEESITFHIIEEHAYHANLLNINKAYTGSTSQIISKISDNFLGMKVLGTGNDTQVVKLIVPNLDPIESLIWIKNRATTTDGYPFYLFSTLAAKNLVYSDLGTLLSQNVINPEYPYTGYPITSREINPTIQRRTLLSYDIRNTENLFDLIRKGLVGAKYEYLDVVKNTQNKITYDIATDLLKPLLDKSVVQKNQRDVLYSPDYTYNGTPFNELPSRYITRMGGSSAYEDNMTYAESKNKADYKLEIIASSMDQIMKKSPITVVVNGIDFISGDAHYTIGNNLRIHFLSSRSLKEKNEEKLDRKKSGDYLIFSAKHMFKKEKYDISFNCVKIANYSELSS